MSADNSSASDIWTVGFRSGKNEEFLEPTIIPDPFFPVRLKFPPRKKHKNKLCCNLTFHYSLQPLVSSKGKEYCKLKFNKNVSRCERRISNKSLTCRPRQFRMFGKFPWYWQTSLLKLQKVFLNSALNLE
jgi:hypothetical protein